jgi:competence protein ComEA
MIHRRVFVISVVVLCFAGLAGAADPPAAREGRAAAAPAAPGRVNINTADVKTLMTLEGVGRRVAERIVEYRQAHGPFKRPEEIRRVEGIGAGLWEKNRARIVVAD